MEKNRQEWDRDGKIDGMQVQLVLMCQPVIYTEQRITPENNNNTTANGSHVNCQHLCHRIYSVRLPVKITSGQSRSHTMQTCTDEGLAEQ